LSFQGVRFKRYCQLTIFVSFSGLFACWRSASAIVKFDEKPKHNGLIELLKRQRIDWLDSCINRDCLAETRRLQQSALMRQRPGIGLTHVASKRKILIMMITRPEVTETPLVLGDYVTVHVSDAMANQFNSTEPCDMQVRREELFQRIQKQRGAIFQQVRKPEGKLFDPRRRGAA